MLRSIEQLNGIHVLVAKCFIDERGFLLQSYMRSDLTARGIHAEFRQAIQSKSRRGAVRGMHFQFEPPQGKLVRCVSGRIFDVVVDLRHGSPTQRDHGVVELSGRNHKVIWIPPGFAHGFMAVEDDSVVLYECTAEWSPAGEWGILWNDSALGIDWPPLSAIVSQKDRVNPTLAEWLADPRSSIFSVVEKTKQAEKMK